MALELDAFRCAHSWFSTALYATFYSPEVREHPGENRFSPLSAELREGEPDSGGPPIICLSDELLGIHLDEGTLLAISATYNCC